MEFLVIIFILVIIVVVVYRKRSSNLKNMQTSGTENVDSPVMLRDFIKDADSFLEPPKPFRDLLIANPDELMKVLQKFAVDSGTYQRKAAVFALGQIGNPLCLDTLNQVASSDQASGVRDVARASIAAIEQAPFDRGHTELERRKIIEKTYDGMG